MENAKSSLQPHRRKTNMLPRSRHEATLLLAVHRVAAGHFLSVVLALGQEVVIGAGKMGVGTELLRTANGTYRHDDLQSENLAEHILPAHLLPRQCQLPNDHEQSASVVVVSEATLSGVVLMNVLPNIRTRWRIIRIAMKSMTLMRVSRRDEALGADRSGAVLPAVGQIGKIALWMMTSTLVMRTNRRSKTKRILRCLTLVASVAELLAVPLK